MQRLTTLALTSTLTLSALGCSGSPPPPPSATGSEGAPLVAAEKAGLGQGDRVRCKWQGGSKQYAGRIAAVAQDGALEVHYDDGDQELTHQGLCEALVDGAESGLGTRPRRITGPSDATAAKKFSLGARVACRWKGGHQVYSGRIAGVTLGRLAVDYDDGDVELINPGLCRAEGGLTPTKAMAAGLAGRYRITEGSNPNGKTYKGQITLRPGGGAYQLDWSLVGGSRYVGIGIHQGELLGVGWAQVGAKGGVVVYEVVGGRLTGKWAGLGGGGLGVENLSGPQGLSGSYKITEGRNPSGAKYGGTVQITPTGETLRFDWKLPGTTYTGTGVRVGEFVVVGWGQGSQVGAVAYGVKGSQLDGVWAAPGGKRLGRERAERGDKL